MGRRSVKLFRNNENKQLDENSTEQNRNKWKITVEKAKREGMLRKSKKKIAEYNTN